MSEKRHRVEEESDQPRKRAKPQSQPPVIEEINFARQLQQLLTFRQDGIQQLKDGIASFKKFLESLLYHKDEENRARQISILREYLDTQKPADPNSLDRPFLSQLWQAWSFANQNQDDHLTSTVSAVLALLLKTLSSLLDLREQGFLLCRTVIQNQHLRLIKRCLDAPKHKEHVISPSLRLLTEVTSFDGGVLAKEVYKRREQTFDVSTLRRHLGWIKLDVSDEEARRRPSIRTQALRYILQHLKYLHEGGKIDILKNRGICSALFQNLMDDPTEVVIDLLSITEQSILKDRELPRSAKSALLTSQNLERATEVATRAQKSAIASERAFSWLKAVCTTPSYGILRPHGWYPPGTSKEDETYSQDIIATNVDSVEVLAGERSFNLKNPTLLTWIRSLRPHSNTQERELLIWSLTAAPELVAAYVSEKGMQMDPKLSNTWIGLASVLFEIVRLPVPEFLGNENGWAARPPSPSVIIENILPRPLTLKVLTRCLNQSNQIISFFVVRILILAFQKLDVILRQLKRDIQNEAQTAWSDCSETLLQLFVGRCPDVKNVIASFRQVSDDEHHLLQREALARLLRLYYQVTPLQALEEPFDVSTALTTALTRSQSQAEGATSETHELRGLELEHLLTIGQHSTSVRWFHKGSLRHSPVVTLLRIFSKDPSNRQIRSLFDMVLCDCGILNVSDDGIPASQALLASILELSDASAVWDMIDDYIARASRKPVKYVDDLEAISRQISEERAALNLPSILAAVLLEQAPFLASKADSDLKAKTVWIKSFLDLLSLTEDAGPVLQRVIGKIDGILPATKRLATVQVRAHLHRLDSTTKEQDAKIAEPSQADEAYALPYRPLPMETDNHPELLRWAKKDMDMAIEDGDIVALILCLCSQYADVRRQALIQIKKVGTQLRTDLSIENSAQLGLVLGEVSETFEQQYLDTDQPLPYLAGTFAARAFHIQTQPAHDIYPKVNSFLIRGPEWRVSRLPSYWLANTVLSMPEEDEAYWREVRWVLDWLVDGLRSQQDLTIMRRGKVFEKLMALARSPGVATHGFVTENVCELLWRTTEVEGGSMMLVTRFSVLAWLQMMATDHGEEKVFGALSERIIGTCDQTRLNDWKQGKRAIAPAGTLQED